MVLRHTQCQEQTRGDRDMSDVKVHCTDKGMDVDGFILNHNPGVFIDVAINTVKVKMNYEERFDQYVGNMAGLEWIVKGSDISPESNEFKR
jgi:hypothetical protein|tara:strand:- start:584 stop:856 length:273 start_codon:yes stop_codon:yes gene_type:complete